MKKPFFTIAGIPLQIHWSFWLLIAWIIFSNAKQGFDITHISWSLFFTALVFTCVLLHELGHALTARRFGIQTSNIILLPIGGLANIEKMPESPKQELWITAMGPVVNLLIALFLFPFVNVDLRSAGQLNELAIVNGSNILFNLFAINIFMVLFNLIPAFPMDGGRILRATLAYFTGWQKATKIASIIGNIFAVIFLIIGIYTLQFFLALIGIFVLFAGKIELTQVKNKSVLSRFRVKDVLITDFHMLFPTDLIQKAADLLLSTQHKSFVVLKGGLVAGVLTQKEIIRALSLEGPLAQVSKYMNIKTEMVDEEEMLSEVYSRFSSGEHSVLLVTSHGSFIGLLDSDNLDELLALYKKGDKGYFPSMNKTFSDSY